MQSQARLFDRVLVVEHGGRGGVADYTAELVAALVDEGAGVMLATAKDHLYKPPAGVEIWTPFYYFRGGSNLRNLVRGLRLHKLINALAGLVTAGAPDISDMHARSLRDGLRTLQLAFREASPIADPIGKGPGEKWTGPVT